MPRWVRGGEEGRRNHDWLGGVVRASPESVISQAGRGGGPEKGKGIGGLAVATLLCTGRIRHLSHF